MGGDTIVVTGHLDGCMRCEGVEVCGVWMWFAEVRSLSWGFGLVLAWRLAPEVSPACYPIEVFLFHYFLLLQH